MNNHLSIKTCPKCWRTPQIIVSMPTFGKQNIKFKCPNCGFEKSNAILPEFVSDGESISTPVTVKSLAKSIFIAVEKWNESTVNLSLRKEG